jgi:hypothetical protein
VETHRVLGGSLKASKRAADEIEGVVHELNGICRTSSLEFALKVGAVIIHNFYGGDTKAWRDRGPKTYSFRRLAKHPDLLISAGALFRCVAVFELCDRLRAASRWRRLGASHLRAVIGMPPDRQEELLAIANEQRWSVQLLQTKAQELRQGSSRGGRRARSPLEKNLHALNKRLLDFESALKELEERGPLARKSDLKIVSELEVALQQLGHSVETLRKRLALTAQSTSEPFMPRLARGLDCR